MANTKNQVNQKNAIKKREINLNYYKKFKHISLRVEPNDYIKLELKAKQLGFTTNTGKTNVTSYVLNRSLKENAELLKELNDYKQIQFQIRKMGVNLNQLTKKMNQLSGSISSNELENQLVLIKAELRAILTKL